MASKKRRSESGEGGWRRRWNWRDRGSARPCASIAPTNLDGVAPSAAEPTSTQVLEAPPPPHEVVVEVPQASSHDTVAAVEPQMDQKMEKGAYGEPLWTLLNAPPAAAAAAAPPDVAA
eukprot:2829666-Prymnesium_polylepis.1